MSTKLLSLTLAPLALLGILIAACGGGDDRKFPETVQVGADDVIFQFANSEIILGENRLAFGLIGPDGRPIVDGDVHLTFYELTDGQETERFSMPAISRVPARDAGIEEQVEHEHADGSRHVHTNVGEELGVYTANVTFDKPGTWGMEVEYEKGDMEGTLLPRFNVITQASTPPIGFDAPRSDNRTVEDVDDITLIDSSANPSEEMHTTTIAEAIEAGRPTLVLFAVPGFCTSRLCGPEIAIMRQLYPEWKDRVEFIHVEFYKVPGASNPEPVEAVKEWGLRTEPWFFLIDSEGKIAAKFEGPASRDELVNAMQDVVSGS